MILAAINWSAGPPMTGSFFLLLGVKILLTFVSLCIAIKIVRMKSSLVSVFLISLFTYVGAGLCYYFFMMVTSMDSGWASLIAVIIGVFLFLLLLSAGTEGNILPEGLLVIVLMVAIQGGIQLGLGNIKQTEFVNQSLPFVKPLWDKINAVAAPKEDTEGSIIGKKKEAQ